MSSRSSHRISVARHVYLRTQQHRLRHVRSVVIRNLIFSESSPALFRTSIAMEMYFTLYSVHTPDQEFYRSYPVQGSYNPSWEAVQFNSEQIRSFLPLPSFTLKLWLKAEGSRTEPILVFERIVELSSLVYLGTLVNKDGGTYPPNSVVLGMFEGYYSHPRVGGVPCPPKITHALEKLLPPQSLLEVNRMEVKDSYVNNTLLELIQRQEELNVVTSHADQAREKVQSLVRQEEVWFNRRRQEELVRMRLTVLRSELVNKERDEAEERAQLTNFCQELDIAEQKLAERRSDLEQQKEQYKTDSEIFSKKRELLVRAKRSQLLRQKNMIVETAFTFFITELRDKFTICNVILLNSDQLDQPSNVEQPGVALGYVAHLVHHLAQILLVPLQYEIRPNGSRSHICDYISDEAIIDDIREFPLYLKGVERALFHYAVHLLNKNIAQIRQHCGYGMSKAMLKRTLPNLKFILEKIISELQAQSDNGHEFTIPSSGPRSLGSPVPVPSKVARDRPSEGSASSTPLISLTGAESEVYSTSILSEMSFQPSEESTSRPLSPQDPEQTFYGQFEHIDIISGDQSSPVQQHYPGLQTNLTGRHYPANASKTSQDNDSTASIQKGSFTSASGETFLVLEQSCTAHADLHRSVQHRMSQDIEELSSVGLHREDYSPPPIQDNNNTSNSVTSSDKRTVQPRSCDQVSSVECVDHPPVIVLATPHRVNANSADTPPVVTNGKPPLINSPDGLLEDFIDGV